MLLLGDKYDRKITMEIFVKRNEIYIIQSAIKNYKYNLSNDLYLQIMYVDMIYIYNLCMSTLYKHIFLNICNNEF